MSKRNIVVIVGLGLSLSGCAALDTTASSLGVNFWNKKAKLAPCKPLASLSDDLPCVGVPLTKPKDDEILKLRGRYIVINSAAPTTVAAAP